MSDGGENKSKEGVRDRMSLGNEMTGAAAAAAIGFLIGGRRMSNEGGRDGVSGPVEGGEFFVSIALSVALPLIGSRWRFLLMNS